MYPAYDYNCKNGTTKQGPRRQLAWFRDLFLLHEPKHVKLIHGHIATIVFIILAITPCIISIRMLSLSTKNSADPPRPLQTITSSPLYILYTGTHTIDDLPQNIAVILPRFSTSINPTPAVASRQRLRCPPLCQPRSCSRSLHNRPCRMPPQSTIFPAGNKRDACPLQSPPPGS